MGKDTILSNDFSTEFDLKQQYYPYDKAPLSSLLEYYGRNKNWTYMTVFIPDSCCIACSIHPTRTAFLIDEEAKILYTPLWVNEPESRKKRKGSPLWSSLLLKVPQLIEWTSSFSKQYQFIILKGEHSHHLSKTVILPHIFLKPTNNSNQFAFPRVVWKIGILL